MRVDLLQRVDVVVGGAYEEGIVDMTLPGSQLSLCLKGLERGGLWLGVGHVEERCHATIGGSTALTLHVGLGGESRLTKMDMTVDDTRKHITAVGIDLAVTAGAVKTSTCLCVFTFSDDVLYKAVFHNDGRATSLSFVDNYSVFYYQSHLID